jgi:hypothetical protein
MEIQSGEWGHKMNGYINKKYSKIKKEDKMKILP